MTRVSSGVAVRLSDILNVVYRIGLTHGEVRAVDVAHEAGISDRMVRDYMGDLVALGVLNYLGAGRYSVNMGKLKDMLELLSPEPVMQLKLTHFVDQPLLNSVKVQRRIDKKLKKVFKKLKLDLLFDGDGVREKISELRPFSGSGVIGDRYILPRAARFVELDGVFVPGSASEYNIEHYVFMGMAVLSNIYLSAAIYNEYFEGGVANHRKSQLIVYPDFTSYSGKEPLVREDPFYELTTDFPDLLGFARNIAAKYLMEIIHLETALRFLEEHGDKFEVFFRARDLIPHGYFFTSKQLEVLKDRMFDLFYKFLKVARRQNVLVASVSYRVHDNFFLRTIERALGMRLAETTDDNFLNLILRDGDTTALIYREKEKGKPPIKNWYEFYIKYKELVYRVDFIALNDPFEDYEKIRDIAYSSSTLPPAGNLYPGPASVSAAQFEAKRNAESLKNYVSRILHGAVMEHLRNLTDERNMERFRRLFDE